MQDLNILYQVCVFQADQKKKRTAPRLIGWDFSTKTTEQNSTKLDRKQDLNILYQVWFVRLIRKTRWPPRPLISWDIFNFSSETAEQNSTKLDMKQDLNTLYQVCVFRANQKNKMVMPASDWLRQFRLLLWNHWMEFNKTWQEARSQRPLPSLCFSGWSEKQAGHQSLWLAETFSTSPLKPLNESTKLDLKQDLNVLYQVFFGLIEKKNKMAPPASDWLRYFQLLLWNRWMEFNETRHEVRSQHPLPSLCFYGQPPIEKQDDRPGLSIG